MGWRSPPPPTEGSRSEGSRASRGRDPGRPGGAGGEAEVKVEVEPTPEEMEEQGGGGGQSGVLFFSFLLSLPFLADMGIRSCWETPTMMLA